MKVFATNSALSCDECAETPAQSIVIRIEDEENKYLRGFELRLCRNHKAELIDQLRGV